MTGRTDGHDALGTSKWSAPATGAATHKRFGVYVERLLVLHAGWAAGANPNIAGAPALPAVGTHNSNDPLNAADLVPAAAGVNSHMFVDVAAGGVARCVPPARAGDPPHGRSGWCSHHHQFECPEPHHRAARRISAAHRGCHGGVSCPQPPAVSIGRPGGRSARPPPPPPGQLS